MNACTRIALAALVATALLLWLYTAPPPAAGTCAPIVTATDLAYLGACARMMAAVTRASAGTLEWHVLVPRDMWPGAHALLCGALRATVVAAQAMSAPTRVWLTAHSRVTCHALPSLDGLDGALYAHTDRAHHLVNATHAELAAAKLVFERVLGASVTQASVLDADLEFDEVRGIDHLVCGGGVPRLAAAAMPGYVPSARELECAIVGGGGCRADGWRAPWFNSGVLQVNVTWWRASGKPAAIERALARRPVRTDAFDQSLLNQLVAPTEWRPLPHAWNVVVAAREQCARVPPEHGLRVCHVAG